jgi:uncharacterized protein (DUF433 family)
MANLDWSQCPAVESIPGKVSGAWVFRDTRTPVSVVFDNLEAGSNINEIIEQFHLTKGQGGSEVCLPKSRRWLRRSVGRGDADLAIQRH